MSAERLLPRPAVSIVVPVYNEEDSLPQLYREVAAAMDSIGRNAELILVDDGSTDRTTRLAGEIAARDSRVLVILLRRNFGQTPALQAGIDQARGEIVITMDGDLQNDPADIPLFLEKLEEGCDIVCGWRKNRKDNLWHRKIPSWAANRLLRLMTGVNIHDSGCSLKAYRGSVIRNARLYSDLHRFIPAITSLSGARVGEIVVHHRARKFGQTKYGISRTWKVLSDLWMIKMVVGFITRPGTWFAILGLPWLAMSLGSLLFSLLAYFGADVPGEVQIVLPTVTMLSFFAFFHVVLLGVVSELILRTGEYKEQDIIEARVLD